MVALLHRKTDGAEEQKCEGALGISRCPTRLNDGHRACRLTFWSMTPHILIQPVSPSHRESHDVSPITNIGAAEKTMLLRLP